MSAPVADPTAVRSGAPATTSDRRRPALRPWLLGAAGVVAALLLWALAARLLGGGGGGIKRLAGPVEVARRLGDYAGGELPADVWASLKVFLGGWIIGGAAATLLGLLLGRVRAAGQLLLPVIETIRPVSSIAWVPLSIVWFGLGYTSKAFVVGLAVFLVVIVYAVDGSARVPADVERTATMLGMSGVQRLRHVILPGTLGEVLVGLRVALMAGWGTVIVAELIAANSGLGAHLISSEQGYDIASVMASMVSFAVTGFLLNTLFSLLQDQMTPWQRVQRGAA